MDGDDTARLLYLTVLLAALVFFFGARRLAAGRTLRQALWWALIFGAVVLGYGLLAA